MTSPSTDHRYGLNSGLAIKAPCDCATTANITLSGEQTIDGVTTSASRVLVKNQTTATANGIYLTDTGSWTRARDFNGNRDLVEGSLILVNRGTTNADTMWRITNVGTITIDTTSLTFERAVVNDSNSVSFLQSGTGAVARTAQAKMRESVSVTDFGAIGNGVADDTAAIQAAMDSLPLNTADTGVMTPDGFANGGFILAQRGRYKLTAPITIQRGTRFSGESAESTQFIIAHTGSGFVYADAGRDIPDEVVLENFSVWQDSGSTPDANTAGIDLIHGPASVDAIMPVVRNVLVKGTHYGVRTSAGIGGTLQNVRCTETVSHGIYSPTVAEGGVTVTSTTLLNCYTWLCGGSGVCWGKGSYVSAIGGGSDSNDRYGYEGYTLLGSSMQACGAEANALGMAYFKDSDSISIGLLGIAAAGTHGITLDNCRQVVLAPGYIDGTLAGSGKYGVNVAVAGGKITNIGSQFIGQYAGANQCSTTANYLNLTDSYGLLGQGEHWGIGNVSTPDTEARLVVGGVASSTTIYSHKINVTHSAAGGTRNAGAYTQLNTSNTAVVYPLAISHYIPNIGKGAASTITRSAGVYIAEHTQGGTANANLMIDAATGTVPAGDWGIYSDSTRANYLKGKLTWAPPSSGAPASNGDLTFLATSNTNLRIQYKGSDGSVRSADITLS